MNSDTSVNVLYVDDEVHNLTAFKASFRRQFNVFTANSAVEGRTVLESEHIHVIVTDQRMPVTTGIEFLESIIPDFPDPIRILLTGYTDINAVIDAINKGQVYRYIQKPWMDEDLRINIEKAYELFMLRKENKDLIASLIVANDKLEELLRGAIENGTIDPEA
ncbi:response regulator [Pedobacter caeni]|uniref:Response regulator receiver domain-containing protein n=1 Tax=Pedobacter caeni TaxID=288992 RepID=A0A1M5GBD9_9SPHI|nr:response regulator [Pedobacter caeni]SHG01009.1 Response regulator receiver domain-containing protein [Pedobacter caeni]